MYEGFSSLFFQDLVPDKKRWKLFPQPFLSHVVPVRTRSLANMSKEFRYNPFFSLHTQFLFWLAPYSWFLSKRKPLIHLFCAFFCGRLTLVMYCTVIGLRWYFKDSIVSYRLLFAKVEGLVLKNYSSFSSKRSLTAIFPYMHFSASLEISHICWGKEKKLKITQ